MQDATRRRSRLLSAFLLVTIPIALTGSLLLPYLSGGRPLSDLQTSTGVLVSLGGLVAYLINRRGHYAVAAMTTIGLAMVGVWMDLLFDPDAMAVAAPYFAVIPIILAAVLTTRRQTFVIVALNVGTILALPYVVPGHGPTETVTAILLISLVSAFVVVLAALRDQDLEENEERSRALNESEARQRAITDHAPDMIFEIDRNGIIRYANHVLPGYGRGQVVGTRITEHVADTDRDRVREVVEGVFTTGAPRAYEFQVRGIDGKTTWYASRLGPIHKNDTIVGATLITQDITMLKEAQEARLHQVETEAELERMHAVARFKNDFVNMAAHELYTPMTPTLLALEMLQDDPDLDPRKARLLQTTTRNVHRMQDILKDLLETARLQNDEVTLARTRVDLGRILDETVDRHQDAASEHRLSLSCTVGSGTYVDADAARVGQIVDNLLDNAIKFTPPGGRVDVALVADDTEATVRVEDDGPGLSPDQTGMLFQPFIQVHDRAQVSAKGTGLGLYIAKCLVDRHGGRIWCDSDGPGRGSRFCFTLPLTASASARSVTLPAADPDATRHEGSAA